MIKVLLVDDHPMVRLGVASFLNLQEDIEVIAEADNGLIGYEKAIALHPDIILMDLVMDVMDGIESTQKILAQWQEAKIVIVTSFIDDEKVIPAIEAGASGYLLKSSSAEEIAQSIRKVYAGEKVLEQPVTDVVLKNMSKKHEKQLHEDLTVREKEVLQLIAKGYSNQEIADELFISLKTVKTHVSNILSKLMVEDRTQVAIYAFKHNLVADD